MWLQNVNDGTYYPYTDLLAAHYGMIVVHEDPFKKAVAPVEVTEELEPETLEEATQDNLVSATPVVDKPKRVVKPPIKKVRVKK